MSVVNLGLRNLSRRKSRTALTLTGVMLAIGFTVGLLSVSEGFMKSIRMTVSDMGPDLMVLGKGEGKAPQMIGMGSTSPQSIADVAAKTPGVRVVEPVYQALTLQGDYGQKGIPSAVVGITPETFFEIRPMVKIAKGRALRPGDGAVCVLGSALAENLKLDLGGKVDLAVPDASLTVVGILEDSPFIHSYYGFANLETIQKMYDDEGHIHFLLAKADDLGEIDEVKARLEKALPENDVKTTSEVVGQIQQMFMMARALHVGVSCFALLIGALFVAATMMMAVIERIREFAALRVIGASKGFVLKLIMCESLALSVVGGIAGCLLGMVLSRGIDLLIVQFVGKTFLRSMVTPRIFVSGLVIALAIGALAGLAPTRLILKRNLSESLRYE